MNFSFTNRGLPAGNPIANALVIVVGTLAIAASIVVGFVAFVILASIVLIMAAVIAIRLWWFNWKFRSGQRPQSADDETIEGEFIVIEKHERESR